MSFKKAREHFQRARGEARNGGRVSNTLKADEATVEALGDSLDKIEGLLEQILLELRAQRAFPGVGAMPAAEAQPDEGGFFRRWLS